MQEKILIEETGDENKCISFYKQMLQIYFC